MFTSITQSLQLNQIKLVYSTKSLNFTGVTDFGEDLIEFETVGAKYNKIEEEMRSKKEIMSDLINDVNQAFSNSPELFKDFSLQLTTQIQVFINKHKNISFSNNSRVLSQYKRLQGEVNSVDGISKNKLFTKILKDIPTVLLEFIESMNFYCLEAQIEHFENKNNTKELLSKNTNSISATQLKKLCETTADLMKHLETFLESILDITFCYSQQSQNFRLLQASTRQQEDLQQKYKKANEGSVPEITKESFNTYDSQPFEDTEIERNPLTIKEILKIEFNGSLKFGNLTNVEEILEISIKSELNMLIQSVQEILNLDIKKSIKGSSKNKKELFDEILKAYEDWEHYFHVNYLIEQASEKLSGLQKESMLVLYLEKFELITSLTKNYIQEMKTDITFCETAMDALTYEDFREILGKPTTSLRQFELSFIDPSTEILKEEFKNVFEWDMDSDPFFEGNTNSIELTN